MLIPFNKPHATGRELAYIQEAISGQHLSGDGSFTKRCHAWLEAATGVRKASLTHSCTAALEMAAMLLEVGPGDEVIMPSYTFVSTANAFVLRGATPVFVDVREDTLNLDERLVEQAITPKTKAICAVHYAGVACEMDPLLDIATRHGLGLVEDAAQALLSTYKGRPLGALGDFGAVSFHETKNVIAGEGGALLVRDRERALRADIIREKGTNRSAFFRGEVDKYTWVDIGSSFLPSEVVAAFLFAQLEQASELTARRVAVYDHYYEAFAELERQGSVRRPIVPAHCTHNGHMFSLLLPDLERRSAFLAALRLEGVHSVFHYVPLHSSPAGLRFGRVDGPLPVTDDVADRLVRLPLFIDLTEAEIERVVRIVQRTCR
jgi:dTDP-4-amino-4,6-dideoxygalactose transaminase